MCKGGCGFEGLGGNMFDNLILSQWEESVTVDLAQPGFHLLR